VVSFSVFTLGCKLNQLESEALADAFRREGYTVLPWAALPQSSNEGVLPENASPLSADILLINTCTVTSKADQKARRLIRKSLRDNQRACVIVTGCYAQLEERRLALLGEEFPGAKRLFVVSGDRKADLLDLPRYLHKFSAPQDQVIHPQNHTVQSTRDLIETWVDDLHFDMPHAGSDDPFRFTPEDFSFHSRPSIKIQDGCDNHCTFCRVRLARGPSVSLEAEKILSALILLEKKACAEAVLTGVNITQYRDRGRGLDLGGLLEYLLAGTSRIAIRLVPARRYSNSPPRSRPRPLSRYWVILTPVKTASAQAFFSSRIRALKIFSASRLTLGPRARRTRQKVQWLSHPS
jgi:threonylcarbamoyladenosine tRNA methylthiotransferase MtaB